MRSDTLKRLLDELRNRLNPPLIAFTLLLVVKQVAVMAQMGEALKLGAERLVLGTIGMALLFGAPLLRWRGARQILLLLAVDGAITLLSLVDLVHYRVFGDLTTVASLRFAGHTGDIGASIAGVVTAGDLVMLASGPLLATGALLLRGASWPEIRRSSARILVFVGIVLIVGVWLTTPRLKRLRHRGNAFLAGELGIVGFHVSDIGSHLAKRSSRLLPDPELEREAREHFEALARANERDRAEAAPGSLFGAARGKNLLIIQYEALQTFLLGMEIEGQRIVPNLEAFAEESLFTDEHFHQTLVGRSSDAKFVTLCSLHALASGAAVFEFVNNELRCLPKILGEAGYTGVAMQLLRPDFWNATSIDASMGFARSYSERDFEHDETIGYGLSDRSFYRQLRAELATLPRPHFAFVQNLSSHHPFRFPDVPKYLDLGEIEGTMLGDYIHAVHYADRALGEHLERMREDGTLDETVVVVYGDHDGVTRRLTDLSYLQIDEDDEWAWADIERGSPLFIRVPGVEAGRLPGPAGQIDLAPTLLDLLGVERRGSYFMGKSLLAGHPEERITVFADGSARSASLLYLRGADGTQRCYDRSGRVEFSRCEELRSHAEKELRLSRGVLEKDLIRVLHETTESEVATR